MPTDLPEAMDGNDEGSGPAARTEDWTIGAVPDWGPACLDDLVDALLSTDSPFPCTFAVAAAKKRTLRFGFIDDLDDRSTWEPLVDVMSTYVDTYQALSNDTSLVVFFRPQRRIRSLEDYHATFWTVLRFLHERDPERWPEAVPQDPEHPMWEFSFGGTSIFVVCNTPAHTRRRSRYSPGFVITFQPRWVFEGLEADTPRGAAARRVIRRRLRAFDGTPPSPALGNYGDPANREWRQYFLPDKNSDPDLGCPFHTVERAREAAVPTVVAAAEPVPSVATVPTAPTTNQPTTNQPTTNQPTTNQPTTNQPTTNRPTTTALRPAGPAPRTSTLAAHRRALHRRMLAEAGLAAPRAHHPGSAPRGGRDKTRKVATARARAT